MKNYLLQFLTTLQWQYIFWRAAVKNALHRYDRVCNRQIKFWLSCKIRFWGHLETVMNDLCMNSILIYMSYEINVDVNEYVNGEVNEDGDI